MYRVAMAQEIALPNLRKTAGFAREVARRLTGREALLLAGELGAGKTTFVRGLVRALGINPRWVSSPSFTLVQRYPAGTAGFGVTHADLYRLATPDDLEAVGVEELWASPDLLVVEWPEALLRAGFPEGRSVHRLTFSVNLDGSRTVLWAEPPVAADAQRTPKTR